MSTAKSSYITWGRVATDTLIDVWSKPEFQQGLDDCLRNKCVYDSIAEEVSAILGLPLTSDQCKNKLRNLKHQYKKEARESSQTGATPSYWPFFEKMDKILATKAAYHSTNVRDSISDDQHSRRQNSESSDIQMMEEDDLAYAASPQIDVETLEEKDMSEINDMSSEGGDTDVDDIGNKCQSGAAKVGSTSKKSGARSRTCGERRSVVSRFDEIIKLQQNQATAIMEAQERDMKAFEKMEKDRMEKESESDKKWFELFSSMMSANQRGSMPPPVASSWPTPPFLNTNYAQVMPRYSEIHGFSRQIPSFPTGHYDSLGGTHIPSGSSLGGTHIPSGRGMTQSQSFSSLSSGNDYGLPPISSHGTSMENVCTSTPQNPECNLSIPPSDEFSHNGLVNVSVPPDIQYVNAASYSKDTNPEEDITEDFGSLGNERIRAQNII